MCLREPVAVLVADDNDEVFAISSRESALRIRSQPRDGALKKASGRHSVPDGVVGERGS